MSVEFALMLLEKQCFKYWKNTFKGKDIESYFPSGNIPNFALLYKFTPDKIDDGYINDYDPDLSESDDSDSEYASTLFGMELDMYEEEREQQRKEKRSWYYTYDLLEVYLVVKSSETGESYVFRLFNFRDDHDRDFDNNNTAFVMSRSYMSNVKVGDNFNIEPFVNMFNDSLDVGGYESKFRLAKVSSDFIFEHIPSLGNALISYNRAKSARK